MKKFISLILTVLLMTLLCSSCAFNRTAPPVSYGKTADSVAPMPGAADEAVPEAGQGVSSGNASDADKSNALTTGSVNASLSGDKIIYDYSATIETIKFDETINNVNTLLTENGAFVETSYISGNSYGHTSFRTADYTIRVPVGNLKNMTGSLSLLGNVCNQNMSSQNITAQFIDTQSRLDAYRTEESRLLAMLGKAATVTDMIAIESRLSDVRYQIESLTTTLKNWQNQVDFSTVTLHIAEVSELTQQMSAQRTYWEQLRDGVLATLKGIGEFFKSFFLAVIVAMPVLILLAVIALIVIIIIRVSNKKRDKKNDRNSQ